MKSIYHGNGGVQIKNLIENGASRDQFKVELLMIGTYEFCCEMEKKMIQTYQSVYPRGLNGNGGGNIVHSEATKAKLSAASLGKKHTEETKAKIGAANLGNKNCLGRTLSEETKEKLSAASLGEKNGMYSKTHSKEAKAKIGAAMKGKPKSQEHKAKIGAASLGKITALNIETGIVTNIPKELYHSRRDIYFHASSRAYKNWKAIQRSSSDDSNNKEQQ